MEAGIWTIWDRNPTSNKLKQTNMYKVGDKVKVRSDLQIDKMYGKYAINHPMFRHVGKWASIVDVNPYSYAINLDSGNWKWSSEMFEDNPSNKLFKLM